MKVPCVAAILWNTDCKVLLQQRDIRPGLAFASHWTLPGGRVEAGEKPEEAIRRELMEETGLDIPLTLWKVYERPHSDVITVVQHVYVGQTDRKVSDLTLGEGQALEYWGSEDVAGLPMAFGFESLLSEFFAKIEEELSHA